MSKTKQTKPKTLKPKTVLQRVQKYRAEMKAKGYKGVTYYFPPEIKERVDKYIDKKTKEWERDK